MGSSCFGNVAESRRRFAPHPCAVRCGDGEPSRKHRGAGVIDHAPLAPRRVPPPGSLAIPAAGEVEVWWATTDVNASTLESLRTLLDDEMLARTNAMVREPDRRRSVVAHGLLRTLVAACTGQDARSVQILRTCASCGSADHGKPSLSNGLGTGMPALQFNLAHSGDVVAVALAAPSTAVGIDVEEIQHEFDWLPARRHVFTDAEWIQSAGPDASAARFALWAKKEAAAKTTGHGLAIDLMHVAIRPGSGRGTAEQARLTAPDRTYDMLVASVELAPHMAAAVATLGADQPLRVRTQRAQLED